MIPIPKREKQDPEKARRNFVNNASLLAEIISCKDSGVLSNRLAKMILLMAERYSWKHNFSQYSFREDMVGAAVTNLCNNWMKFDETKSSNPFSYFTTCIHRSFLTVLANEKRERDTKNAISIAETGVAYGFRVEHRDDPA